MIEGFHVDLTSKEINNHIHKMIEYHVGEAAVWEERFGKEREREAAFREQDPNFSRNFMPAAIGVDDPESRIKAHRERVSYLTFLRDHLIPNETFRLTESDLTSLEFVAPFENPSPFIGGLARAMQAFAR